MLQNNPGYGMLYLDMLRREATNRTAVHRLPGLPRRARQNPLARGNGRLLGLLGTSLVGLGHRLQRHQQAAIPGQSTGT